MFEDITEKEWLTFFDVMDRITNERGLWIEKAKRLKKIAENYDSDSALEEMTGWYGDD